MIFNAKYILSLHFLQYYQYTMLTKTSAVANSQTKKFAPHALCGHGKNKTKLYKLTAKNVDTLCTLNIFK